MSDQHIWERVRGWYHFPKLADPKVVPKSEGGAHIDFANLETTVSDAFVEEIVKKTGLSREACLEGIFTHEIGHYMVYPRSLSTIVLAGKFIDDFFKDADYKGFIFQTHADMANDTASMLEDRKRDAVLRMRNASQQTLPDKVNENVRAVMLKYLHHQAGLEYTLDKELHPYFDRMLEIDFLNTDTDRLRLSIFQFGSIVKDMIEKYGKNDPFEMPDDMELEQILGQLSEKELKRALREISSKISRREYEKVKDWLKDKGVTLPEYTTKNIGTSNGTLPVDPEVVDYYKELSKLYPLIIHKKPIKTEKTQRTFEDIEKWQITSEPLLALPQLSGGLFLPTITPEIKIRERAIITNDYDIPHLLIVVDSSGSMPNPKDRKSYAALAGYCAARSYHIQGSAIGVINFSGQSFYMPYTRELDNALGAISAYQGGGTNVDLDMVKKMLGADMAKLYQDHPDMDMRRLPPECKRKDVNLSLPAFKKALEEKSIDLVMFTDGGIGNLDDVLAYFEEHSAVNRATIVLTDHYEQNFTERSNVRVHRVSDDKDIPNIVLGDIESNMSYHATRYESKRK